MAYDVFISYSSKDKDKAVMVCNSLEEKGHSCWIAPRDITPGKEWGEEIIDAINTCRVMVLIFSSSANTSQQVLREVERAINKNVIIIPFRVEDIVPTKSMEYFLYSTHWLDALTPNVEDHLTKLEKTVKKLLENPEAAEKVARATSRKNKEKRINSKVLITALTLALSLAFFIFGSVNLLNKRNTKDDSAATENQNNVIEVVSNEGNPDGDTKKEEEESKEDVSINVEPTKKEESEVNVSTQVNAVDRNMAEEVKEPKAAEQPKETEEVKEPVIEPDKEIEKAEVKNISDSKINFKIGEYIKFGTYNGRAIQWRIINIDTEGNPFLLSEKILTLKAYDSAESGIYNSNGGEINFDVKKERSLVYKDYLWQDLRKMKGSNNWLNSNIRQWLNSSDRTVNYSTQAPIAAAVSGGRNNYDSESGFLHNFTEVERSLIKEVTHKSILAGPEKDSMIGGNQLFSFTRAEVVSSLSNHDSSFYTNVKDKVFLLSLKEAVDYVYDRGWDMKTGLTEEAIERDKSGWYKDLAGQTGGFHMWWLRTPMSTSPSDVCIVGTKGDVIYNDYAAMAGVGIRPSLYLETSQLSVSGEGTLEKPYICNKK